MTHTFPDLLFVFEMANNHQGDVEHGLRIISEMGQIAGRHGIQAAVKLQYRDLDTFIHPDYAGRSDVKHIPPLPERRASPARDFRRLVTATRHAGMLTMVTPFDEAVGRAAASSTRSTSSRWRAAARSTGRCWKRSPPRASPSSARPAARPIHDIDKIVSFFDHRYVKDLGLLHCVGLYPTPERPGADALHAAAAAALTGTCSVGYSGHEAPGQPGRGEGGGRAGRAHPGAARRACARDGDRLNAYSLGRRADREPGWRRRCAMREICGAGREKTITPEEIRSLHQLTRGTLRAARGARRASRSTRDDVFFAMPCGEGQTTSGEFRGRHDRLPRLRGERGAHREPRARIGRGDARGDPRRQGHAAGGGHRDRLAVRDRAQPPPRPAAVPPLRRGDHQPAEPRVLQEAHRGAARPAPPRPLPQGEGGDLPRPPRRAGPLPRRPRAATWSAGRHAAHRARPDPRVPLRSRLHLRGDLDHPRARRTRTTRTAASRPATPWCARRWWRRGEALDRAQRAVGAALQWAGRRPITEPAFPRLALSSWMSELRDGSAGAAPRDGDGVPQPAPGSSGPCTRRASSGGSAWPRRSSTPRRTSVGSTRCQRVGGERLGFWAGVARIPDLRLVDLDDWTPTAAEAAPYATFAREHAPTVAAYDLHVEEHEEGPLARRLPAGRRPRGVDAGGDRRRHRARAPREPGRACSSATAGSSAAARRCARRRARRASTVLTVEGWSLATGPHDLQPGRARARVQPRRLAARARTLGRRARAGCPPSPPLPGGRRRRRHAPGAAAAPPRPRCRRPSPRSWSGRARGSCWPRTWSATAPSSAARRPSAASGTGSARRSDTSRARPHWNLVVRAHPDEAFIRRKVAVRMGEVARELAGGAPNVLVIGGDEDVSSYALMPGLAGGLVWISSIGVGPGRAWGADARGRASEVPRARSRRGTGEPRRVLRRAHPPGGPARAAGARAARARAQLPEPRLPRLLVRRVQPLVPRAGPLPDGARQPAGRRRLLPHRRGRPGAGDAGARPATRASREHGRAVRSRAAVGVGAAVRRGQPQGAGGACAARVPALGGVPRRHGRVPAAAGHAHRPARRAARARGGLRDGAVADRDRRAGQRRVGRGVRDARRREPSLPRAHRRRLRVRQRVRADPRPRRQHDRAARHPHAGRDHRSAQHRRGAGAW